MLETKTYHDQKALSKIIPINDGKFFILNNITGSKILNIDRKMSLVAISISVLALTATLWQGVIAREHNRLSVKPKLLITPMLEGEGGHNGIYISNAGLGAGFIKDAEIIINNSKFDFTKNTWRTALTSINIDPDCFATAWLPREHAIKASDETALLEITKADARVTKKNCYKEVHELMYNRSVSIKINYKSMYGEEFSLLGLGTLPKN